MNKLDRELLEQVKQAFVQMGQPIAGQSDASMALANPMGSGGAQGDTGTQGMPPQDPAQGGGDPAAGQPPMDPAMAGGDPAAAGMDPNAAPPQDPAQGGGDQIDPAMLQALMSQQSSGGAGTGQPIAPGQISLSVDDLIRLFQGMSQGAAGSKPKKEGAGKEGQADIGQKIDNLTSMLQNLVGQAPAAGSQPPQQ